MDEFLSNASEYFIKDRYSPEISLYSMKLNEMIDFSKESFWFSLFSFLFAPLFWNSVGRVEYKTRIFSTLFRSKYFACYLLAIIIFLLQLERDFALNIAIDDQPHIIEAESDINKMVCYFLFFVGTTLVLSSFWALGITGTYLGDYFGILKDEKLTSFPFNVCENPMYTGGILNFLSIALYTGSPAGVLLTMFAQLVYYVSVKYFEGPFTNYIYSQRENENKKKDIKKKK